MKKILSLIILFIIMISDCAFAKNHVDNIHFDIMIMENGDMEITESWTGTFDEHTENYKVVAKEESMNIENFRVADELGEYEAVDNWNVKASFEDKARKCGIIETAKTMEYCFGISNYGKKNYKLMYTIKGGISEFLEGDGFDYMFLNPNLNIYPTYVTMKICLESGKHLTDENSNFYTDKFSANGYYDEGSLYIKSNYAIEGDNAVIVYFEMDKDMTLSSSERNGYIQLDLKTSYVIFALALLIAIAVFYVTFRKPPEKKEEEKEEKSILDTEVKRVLEILEKEDVINIDEDIINIGIPPLDRSLHKAYRVLMNASFEERELPIHSLVDYIKKNKTAAKGFFQLLETEKDGE